MKRWILLLAALIASCSIIPAFALAGEATLPQLSAVSTIFGSGDTGGKTTVKHILVTAEGPGDQTIRYSDPETGERTDYPVYNENGTLFEVEQPPGCRPRGHTTSRACTPICFSRAAAA